MTYRDRLRPLRRLGALLRETVAGIPAFRPETVDVPERLITDEGEYAALITMTGSERGARVQRDLGFVFGDDFYSTICSVCFEPSETSSFTNLVRALVRQDSQALGVRRRRFEYTPPSGWQPLRRSLATEWIAPDYPSDPTWLMVYAANPISVVPEFSAVVDGVALGGYTIEDRGRPERVVFGALSGQAQQVRATKQGENRLSREVVMLTDHRYMYLFELSSHSLATWTTSRETLRTLLATVCPLPGPCTASASTFAHWSE